MKLWNDPIDQMMQECIDELPNSSNGERADRLDEKVRDSERFGEHAAKEIQAWRQRQIHNADVKALADFVAKGKRYVDLDDTTKSMSAVHSVTKKDEDGKVWRQQELALDLTVTEIDEVIHRKQSRVRTEGRDLEMLLRVRAAIIEHGVTYGREVPAMALGIRLEDIDDVDAVA